MRTSLVLGVVSSFALLSVAGHAAAPNVKGRIIGHDKLVPAVYAEAAKPEARRWTWREPSPSVSAQFRTLAANPSRDICVAAMRSDNQGPQEPIRMTVTGGRVFSTPPVVAPNTQLAFKNFDPFKHRVYISSGTGQAVLKAEDLQPNAVRTWAPSGPGRYEVRDELFPSVRTYVVVDPQVAQIAYPGRDGAFGFSLPPGDYVLKTFFDGAEVGKVVPLAVKEKGTTDLREPLNVGVTEGAAAK
jgi:hypothetical protein